MSTTDFATACAAYDENFRRRLAHAIVQTIIAESRVTDPDVSAIRIAATTDALADAVGLVLAGDARMDVPSRLRATTDALARRIRRDVARARAEGLLNRAGAAKGGHA
jgi:hypothetical protein